MYRRNSDELVMLMEPLDSELLDSEYAARLEITEPLACDKLGRTKLMDLLDSEYNACLEIYETLAREDTDIEAEDDYGQGIIERIIRNKNAGYLEIILMLLAKKGKINTPDGKKKTPLMYAVEAGNVELAKLVLDFNLKNGKIDKYDNSILMSVVVTCPIIEMVELLIPYSNIQELDEDSQRRLKKLVGIDRAYILYSS